MAQEWEGLAVTFRDKEVRRIEECLQPLIGRERPLHAWLHGPPGSGKSTTLRTVLQRWEQAHHVPHVVLNAWECRTARGITMAFAQALDRLSPKRTPLERAIVDLHFCAVTAVKTYLGEAPLILVLEEADTMAPAELSTALYALTGIPHLALIAVARSEKRFLELDDRVRSRLDPVFVRFPAYTEEEMIEILKQDATSPTRERLHDAVRLAHGDARVALRRLHAPMSSGATARERTIRHALSWDHRAVLSLMKRTRGARTDELWQRYLCHCASKKKRPAARRTFRKYCRQLADLGLVRMQRARGHGACRTVTLGAWGAPTRVRAREEPSR